MTDPRLPSFLIIGARRAGTTSLYDYLTQHPRVARAKRKELHFFDREYHRGIGWYRSQFPWWLRFRRNVITGEATPYYLFHPEVPARVRATLPDARFIVLLRNPVDRAFSHYQTARRREYETLSFEDAIDAEPGRLEGEAEKLKDPKQESFAHSNLSYVSRGIYADQLAAWRSCFGPERFLIVKSEEMYAEPAETVRQTFGFLGLEPFELNSYPHHNNSRHGQHMDERTRARLIDLYRPHNERLYALIDRDLGWDR